MSKVIAFTLVVSLITGCSAMGIVTDVAAASKKPSISKTVNVNLGKTVKIKIKNGNKKAKVSWKTSNKKIANIVKKSKTNAKVKGIKVGNATITADYKIKGKITHLKCKVKVVDVKNDNVNNNISTATPGQQPYIQPTVTPAPTAEVKKDVPAFIGFKTYDDGEIGISDSGRMSKMSLGDFVVFAEDDENVNDRSEDDKNEDNKNEDEETIDSELYAPKIEKGVMNVNLNCTVLVKLTFENSKRDNIVEIVLNDSEYGKKQIYTPNSMKNKIISADTTYDEVADTYVTDVLIALPPSTKEGVRTIDIEECSFLREITGVKGYIDMSKARTISFTIETTTNLVESDSLYFTFEKNIEGGYTIRNVSLELLKDYPLDTISVPSYYKGLPVTKIASYSFSSAVTKRLVFPSTIKEIEYRIFEDIGGLEEVYILGKASGEGFNYLESFTSNLEDNKKYKIIIDKETVSYYYDAAVDLQGRIDAGDNNPSLNDAGWLLLYEIERPYRDNVYTIINGEYIIVGQLLNK